MYMPAQSKIINNTCNIQPYLQQDMKIEPARERQSQ